MKEKPPAPAAPEAPKIVKVQSADSKDLAALLNYIQQTKSMSVEALNAEYTKIKASVAREKAPLNQFKLAVLMSIPDTSFNDDARALSWLKEFSESKSESTLLKEFSVFLTQSIEEQRAAEERYQKLNQKLKEEQTRREAIQKQLDALKRIEKSISEREQITTVPK